MALRWWRVELGPLGIPVRVQQVESQTHPEALLVYYVQAVDEAGARLEAAKKRKREQQRQHRQQLDSRGLCRCGRPRYDGYRCCSVCRQRRMRDQERMLARRSGEVVETPPKREAFQQRSEEKSEDVRRETLIEVYDQWMRSQTNAAFSDWLHQELEGLGVTSSKDARHGRLADWQKNRI